MGGERLEIILAVEPVPKARPRFGQGRAYTPERTASFETTVRWLMRQATLKQKLIIPALTGNIAVDMTFWTRSETSDWDNYAKAICDAGNKILWKDDRQIKEAHVRVLKITASMLPHIELAAWELD